MKKLILLILLLAMAAANATAARMYPAGGRVVDEQGQAVEYATVVLLRGGEQVAGMATDDAGRFELKVPTGEYTLSIQYLGFAPVLRQVRVEADNDLGDIVLKSSSTQIEGVVVKAQLIRREADRFVVDVANAPAAIGKDGIELLERAPGVWVDDEKISINGKSGSKVYVNDRELRMEPAQLLTYPAFARADDIQKIEVVPTTGADYDADSSGGIIRITLRKRRENGMEGSLSVDSRLGRWVRSVNPVRASTTIRDGSTSTGWRGSTSKPTNSNRTKTPATRRGATVSKPTPKNSNATGISARASVRCTRSIPARASARSSNTGATAKKVPTTPTRTSRPKRG